MFTGYQHGYHVMYKICSNHLTSVLMRVRYCSHRIRISSQNSSVKSFSVQLGSIWTNTGLRSQSGDGSDVISEVWWYSWFAYTSIQINFMLETGISKAFNTLSMSWYISVLFIYTTINMVIILFRPLPNAWLKLYSSSLFLLYQPSCFHVT